MRILILFILIVQTAMPLRMSLADTTDQEDACNLIFRTPLQIRMLTAERLLDYRDHVGLGKKVLIWKYADKITDRVVQRCSELEACTEFQVMVTIMEEVQRVFLNVRRNAGLTALTTLWGAGVGIVFAVGKASGNPALTFLVNNEVSGVTNIFREPVDKTFKPTIRKISYFLSTGGTTAYRVENRGWTLQTDQDRATYTDGEAGKGSQQGFRNDVTNSVQTIQNRTIIAQNNLIIEQNQYLIEQNRTIMGALQSDISNAIQDRLLKLPDNDAGMAREWASLMFFTRHYYANIDITSPQIRALIRPLVSPFSGEIQRLKPLIGHELHILERNEANVQKPGNYNYDAKAAKKYYDQLVFEWFERPEEILRERRSVFDLQ